MSLTMLALTSDDDEEILTCLEQLKVPSAFLRTSQSVSRPFSPCFFSSFARFHRLGKTVPTSRKPELMAKRQWQGRPNTVPPA